MESNLALEKRSMHDEPIEGGVVAAADIDVAASLVYGRDFVLDPAEAARVRCVFCPNYLGKGDTLYRYATLRMFSAGARSTGTSCPSYVVSIIPAPPRTLRLSRALLTLSSSFIYVCALQTIADRTADDVLYTLPGCSLRTRRPSGSPPCSASCAFPPPSPAP